MSIFDKFSEHVQEPKEQVAEAFTREKRKEIGQKRELAAIDDIKRILRYPSMLQNGLHFFHPTVDEVCEVDGLYVSKDTLYVIEIKSKNFSYLYGNTDTGHWYLEYESKTVKSDNVFRQISRQMRIIQSNFPHMKMVGLIFINNKLEDFQMDIIGPKPSDIVLHTDTRSIANTLNLDVESNTELVHQIARLDKANKQKLPKEWR